ncbi:MAG: peptidase M14 [Bryobacteraceae bacterium]|nr:peptidase M14 [Bryobacteraceae bacterium]
MLRCLAPLIALSALAQVPPMPPRSQWETPAMKQAQSLSDSTASASKDWLTVAERSSFRETGDYAETVAFYRRLEKSSPLAKLIEFGKTAEGRALLVLVASKDKAFTPESARRTAKPVVLLQNGIHAGENGGKDAAMMLLRDVLITKKRAALLEHSIILSIAVFNADGHERPSPYNRINENGPNRMGFRVTAQRLNLNRDYVKADTPEMRAWLRLYSVWLPDMLIDNHVTDGSDVQYDATIAAHTEQDIAPQVGAWAGHSYLPRLFSELDKLGHITGWYVDGRLPSGALTVMTASPRYSTGYAAAHNRAALLIETHSLKSFRTRTWSHFDIMAVTLEAMASSGKALRQASIDADLAMQAIKPGVKVFLEGTPDGPGEPYIARRLKSETYRSPISPAPVVRYLPELQNDNVTLVRTLKPKLAPAAPAGYIVPAAWTSVIDLLKAHGIRTEPLTKRASGEFTWTRFQSVQFAPMPFEGRFPVRAFETLETRREGIIPTNSVWVPVAQPAGKLAMHILEPDAPDSAVRWGFFQSIFEQKEYFSDYVFVPYAEAMLAADASLRKEFEQAVATDPTLDSNARARLTWLYRRSPYQEPDKDIYPVLRLDAKPN